MSDRHPTYQLDQHFQKRLSEFLENFRNSGYNHFSKELERIDQYVAMVEADNSERDDHDLRRTQKIEYLLEMTAFGIYDELNREAFNKTKETLIIVPDCLSIHDKECERTDHKRGDICKGCLDDCQAHEIRNLAAKYRAKALFSKRKLSEQLEFHAGKAESLGVVGIACVMMLANGMRTSREVGIPARGVLLNFCGCEHWNDQPFASQVTIEWLKAILREKYGY